MVTSAWSAPGSVASTAPFVLQRQQQSVLITPHGSMQARSAEVVSLSRDTADFMERLDAAEAAADNYDAKYRAAKARLQESEASCGQQAAELQHFSQAFQTEQATAKSAHEAVETLATRLTAIQVRT